jgi:hypothetical protein
METKFQTSFIPKKPMAPIGGPSTIPTKHHGTSFFMGIAIIIFVLSLAGVGAAFAWKQILLSQQKSYQADLATREKQFNTDLISQLKETNIKIDMAKQLLKNHLAISQIFKLIGRVTIENVRFMSMDLTTPAKPGDDIKVTLTGYGTSLSAVAFQSDVMNELEQYGLRKVIKNPILSDPTLDNNGTVAFGFTAAIDPNSLSYETSVTGSTDSTAPTTPKTP